MSDEPSLELLTAGDPANPEGDWILAELATDDDDLTPSDPDVATEVTLRDGRIHGRGGVNRFMGAYALGPHGALTFDAVASTRMAGPDAGMRQEDAFFAALSRAARFTRHADRLSLEDSAGRVLAVLTGARHLG